MPYLVKLRHKNKAALTRVSRKKSPGKSLQLIASCQTILTFALLYFVIDSRCQCLWLEDADADPHSGGGAAHKQCG
jgi:hypothetical protein